MSENLKEVEIKFELETVALVDLRPHPRNYRVHPEDQIKHIIESIREHGFYRNIVVAREGTILAGHGVVEAAREMGFGSVPVVRLDVKPDDPRALKVLAGDNEISRLGEIDDRALTEILKDIKLSDENGLIGTGFDEMMLASLTMVTRPTSEIENFDAAAHWIGMPEYNPGDQKLELVISFHNEKDRIDLLKKIGISKKFLRKYSKGGIWSTWWPPREDDDLISLQFKES